MSKPLSLPSGARKKAFVIPSRQNLVLLALAFIAVNFLIAALYMGGRSNEAQDMPVAIEQVVPLPGTLIASQEEIAADLEDTYTGYLIVDDVRLPEDQLRIVNALGQVFFRPGPDKEIERFAEGNHSATVVFWPQEKTEAQAVELKLNKSYTWSFKAN